MKLVSCFLVAVASCTAAQAQDAGAVLSRMYGAYSSATRYAQSASSTVEERLGQGAANYSGFSSVLRFERPNRLFVQVTSPKVGTVTAVSDGKTLTIHNSMKRQYTRQPAESTLTGILRQLRATGIATDAEPLYFLQGSVSHRVTAPKLKAPATVNGVPCHVLVGSYRTETLMPGSNAQVTLWIGRDDGFLRKTKLVFPTIQGKVRVVDPKTRKVTKEQATTLSRSVTMVIQEHQAAPTFAADTFTFTPPPGSTEAKPPK